jgi:hypothetical protein
MGSLKLMENGVGRKDRLRRQRKGVSRVHKKAGGSTDHVNRRT